MGPDGRQAGRRRYISQVPVRRLAGGCGAFGQAHRLPRATYGPPRERAKQTLDELRLVHDQRTSLERHEIEVICRARIGDATWAEIGDQALHEHVKGRTVCTPRSSRRSRKNA